jgi:putative oxidoreductase
MKISNWNTNGLAAIRIIVGLLMFYHGLEVFKTNTMNSYLEWEVIKKLPFPVLLTYSGKLIELITGFCFATGLFMRIAAVFMAGNMLFICFYIGSGKFYYEDQHPFLFALLALVFFFLGSVKYGLDDYFVKMKRS